jgi:hypothetical protein
MPCGTADGSQKKVNFYKVPIANVIYDTFFDEPPDMAQVNQLMNTFGLLNGLLLAVAAAVMNIFSPEDAKNVWNQMQEWAKDPALQALLQRCPSSLPCENAYEDYVFTSNVAFVFLGSAVMMLVLAYLFTAAISFSATDVDGEAKAMTVNRNAYRAWWSVVRWLFLLMAIMTAIGVYVTVVAVQSAWVVQNGHTPQKIRDLTNACIGWDVAVLAVVGGIVPTLLLSAGLINRETALGRELLFASQNQVESEP